MRSHGDISESDRQLVEELRELEHWFNKSKEFAPLLYVAKCMVAISVDYYSMEMDEEGDRILKNVEDMCPGYFRGPILSHMENDELFAVLVNNGLKKTVAIDTMRSFGFGT